jgi:aspartyl-tRNA(Asn)/glutamyl-tRNA(Gln) amidotransferase subunit A
VREVPLPALDDARLVLLGTQSEAQSFLLPLALDRPDGFASRDIRNRIIANDFVRAADARRALQLRTRIRHAVAEAMIELDLLLLPTNSTPAFPIGTGRVGIGVGDDAVDLTARGGQSRLTTRLTLPFNVLGLPALSMPATARVDGLPIGLQLVGHAWAEPLLLRAALALEEATTAGFIEPPIAGRAAAASLPAPRPVAALGATR